LLRAIDVNNGLDPVGDGSDPLQVIQGLFVIGQVVIVSHLETENILGLGDDMRS